MRLAEGPKHLDSATGSQRRGLPGDPALTDARRSDHVHDGAAAVDRTVDDGVERRHLPAPADQADVGTPDSIRHAGLSPPTGTREPALQIL